MNNYTMEQKQCHIAGLRAIAKEAVSYLKHATDIHITDKKLDSIYYEAYQIEHNNIYSKRGQ